MNDLAGALLFSRYAYPPNELGYCGPDDQRALLEYGSSGEADRGLVELARGFEGAWPYLELIAAANSIPDPLDARVVEAYWLGSPLLDRVTTFALGSSLEDRFRTRSGTGWPHLTDMIDPAARLSHAFHVFAVYPWVGLLRAGREGEPLRVLDRCRIRWGRVTAVDGFHVTVESRPLVWDGQVLSLGSPIIEQAVQARDGLGFVHDLEPDDVVSLHWDWVCDRLDPLRLANLRRYTISGIDLTNRVGPGFGQEWRTR